MQLNRLPDPGEIHSYAIGATKVTVLSDGYRSFPLSEGFVLNVGLDEVSGALEEAGMPGDTMTIHFNPVLIETASERVLVDTGNGPEASREPGATSGFLLEALAAANTPPDAIDRVVISHFHGDHVAGLVTDGAPTFPNAEIVVPEAEWRYWMDDGEMARAPEGRMQNLFALNRRIFGLVGDRVRRHDEKAEVASGMICMPTPGHTPGHTSYILSSGDESVFILSDVSNHPALFARHPGWHAMFDMDPAQAEATRRRVYDMLAAERMPVQGFHYPLPAHAFVEKDAEGYRVIAVETG